MLAHPIENAGNLCNDLKSLLEDDIDWLKRHPHRFNFKWGNMSTNLIAKFLQYDNLNSLPIFDQLSVAELYLDQIFLYHIKPNTTKILWNPDFLTKELIITSLIIPLDYTPVTQYVWYDSEHIKPHHGLKDFTELYNTHGVKMIAKSHEFEKKAPLLVEHKNIWSGIINKNNPAEFNFLEITFKGNPSYNKIKSVI